MRYWVDPPSGWKYGFPKIWDTDNDPPMKEWLALNGYPDVDVPWVRTWVADVEEKCGTTCLTHISVMGDV